MKTTANKTTEIMVKPHPVLTKETLAELFTNGTIEVDTEEKDSCIIISMFSQKPTMN